MPDLEDYATEDWPLRASSLNALASCVGFTLLRDPKTGIYEDDGSPAAHNGTAVGRGIELYHHGADLAEIMSKVRTESLEGSPNSGDPFPDVDWATVKYWLLRYMADPRNPRDAVVAHTQEQKMQLRLEAADSDPTGKPIFIQGSPDQIRECPHTGEWSLWDVKSGKPQGFAMLNEYAWQLCAYTLAACQKYDREVMLGGIVRVRGYDAKREDPELCDVFYHMNYTPELCRRILDSVPEIVAQVRSGIVLTTPCVSCLWCPGGGIANCGLAFDDAINAGLLT